MTAQRTVLDRDAFVDAVRYMNEEDLLFINRMVVERLNLLEQLKRTVQLSHFATGDRVCFTLDTGEVKRGVIVRLNKKTATLITDDQQHWNVAPSLLRKDGG